MHPHRLPPAMLHLVALLASFIVVVAPARADIQTEPALEQLQRLTGQFLSNAAPHPAQLASSPTRGQQLPLFREVMAKPLEAPARAGTLAQSYIEAVSSPHALTALTTLTGVMAGLRVERSTGSASLGSEALLREASDPLAASLAWMAPMATPGMVWLPALPGLAQLPDPLRFEVALVLSAMARSHRFVQRAFAGVPQTATPALLRRQALEGDFLSSEEPDFRQLLGLIEREALLAGMLDLVAAVERLQGFVAATPRLPAVAWTLETPMGWIVIDTTGQSNRHRLKDALFVLDVGGDDDYEFLPRSDAHRISVLLDVGGNDRYVTRAAGADPSSATLGLGILWDTEGNDYYEGTQQAQASALFGAALLVDGGGNNEFIASGHSQAHAIGGLAVLLGSPGNDRFTAQTHSQGSAGPHAVAVLIDPSGDDQYTLSNTPLSRPSSQLPDRNTSMGQGAGRGLRADAANGGSSAGGIGILLDLAGNDRYVAQVFAQGVGYYEGLGLLIDDGGNDSFDAAWYAMGAAAHRGAGMLIKRGDGNDSYHASHSIALGAAHDFAVGIFIDERGNDRYAVSDLGLGAAHDNSFALFVDAAGDDSYGVGASACNALGTARLSEEGGLRKDLANIGLFMDLGGADRYPVHCDQSRNNAEWTAKRDLPPRNPRSETGSGLDGEWPMPFAIRPATSPAVRRKTK